MDNNNDNNITDSITKCQKLMPHLRNQCLATPNKGTLENVITLYVQWLLTKSMMQPSLKSITSINYFYKITTTCFPNIQGKRGSTDTI